jgi:ribose transport system substrate-binding protein
MRNCCTISAINLTLRHFFQALDFGSRISSILLLAILIAFPACQRQDSARQGPTIALVMKTLNNPFFVDMERGARQAADKVGVNLIVQAAEREIDVEKQMQIIENLIQRKVAVLCITPSGSREVIPAIVKANQAGISILIVDTRVDAPALSAAGGKAAAFIGSDNVEGGRMAGNYLAARLQGKGKIAVLEGIPGHETGDARLKGFREAVSKTPGLQIVASQTANWERDQGYTVCQNLLQSHPDLQGIFACNDLMALGALEAIAQARSASKITVVGFDATSDARQAIRSGTMAASVAQNPEAMGRLAVENALALIQGKNISSEIPVPVELVTAGKP